VFAFLTNWQERRRRNAPQQKALTKMRESRESGLASTEDGTLFVLGWSALPDRGYTIEYLREAYDRLLAQLKDRYDFVPDRVLVEVEASQSGPFMTDAAFRQRFSVKRYARGHIECLEVTEPWPVAGHEPQVILRVKSASYYEGYGFFVYGHPGVASGEGRWCRDRPDEMAIVSRQPIM
jgi:hypothetical protein